MSATSLRQKLLAFALTFPEAYEDHPWGESVAKVVKKVFVFFGTEEHPGMTVKLLDATVHEHAISLKGAEPSAYGLGASGWVTIPLKGRSKDYRLLCEFIDESFRAVCPKRLIAKLDG